MILMMKKLLEHFMKKNCKKTNHSVFRIEKLFKSKVNRRYVKWKSDDNSFNSWTDKKEIA